jgi:hypothetical protein
MSNIILPKNLRTKKTVVTYKITGWTSGPYPYLFEESVKYREDIASRIYRKQHEGCTGLSVIKTEMTLLEVVPEETLGDSRNVEMETEDTPDAPLEEDGFEIEWKWYH